MMTEKQFIKIKMQLMEPVKVPVGFLAKNDKEFYFKWIHHCSANDVLQIRNAKNVLKMSADHHHISLKMHKEFLALYSVLPRIDFMIVDKSCGRLIGALSLTLTENGIEIGKYIGVKSYLGIGVAKNAMYSFLDFLRREFSGQTLLAKTRNDNTVNITLNRKLGFTTQEALDNDYILMKLELD